jgi:proteasome lid subunit RPN8/RPN11
MGEPYLGGFRVILSSPSGGVPSSYLFSSDFFKTVAQAAAARLVQEGELEEGARFLFRPTAFLRDPQPVDPRASSFRTEPRAPQLSLEERCLSDFQERSEARNATREGRVPVFVPGRVLEGATALAVSAGEKETGGILIGYLRRDPAVGELFVEITEQLPAEYAEGSSTRLSFTPDAWTAVRAALDLRRQGEIMLGWWHSHVQSALCPDCSEEDRAACRFREDFFSSHDHALHRTVFPRAYSVALVVNVVTAGPPTHSLFGWSDGLIRPRSFSVFADAPLAPATADV